MPRKFKPPPVGESPSSDLMPGVPLPAVLSFLRDMRSVVTWSTKDLIEILRIGEKDAGQVVQLLELQGYVARKESGEWLTTAAGEEVCGGTAFKFQQNSVDGALSDLFDHIAKNNKDESAAFEVVKAVAFGDFLLGLPSAHAADVGIGLVAKDSNSRATPQEFLTELKGRGRYLRLQPFQGWMAKRTHRNLLPEGRPVASRKANCFSLKLPTTQDCK